MNSTSSSYTLSQTLSSADAEPVRSLAVCTKQGGNNNNEDKNEADLQLIAGSQNGILSIFNLDGKTNECMTMMPNDGSRPHSTTSLLAIPEHSTFGYASGSRDANIRIYSKDNVLVKTLKGHEKPVTSLSWLFINHQCQYLVSGSWDGAAKIWDLDTEVCVATLSDHENTVTVLALNNTGKMGGNTGKIVTASAGIAQNGTIVNHKIRIWSVEAGDNFSVKCTLLHTPSDNHSGPIRGLASDDSASHLFFSCSNDGSFKFREREDGECVHTVSTDGGPGQPPILLDIASHLSPQNDENQTIAIAGEDGTLIVYSQDNSDIQRILHPGCVWKVTFLPNGDIATACQDGNVRIFTINPARYASPNEIKELEEASLETQKKVSSGPSAEEIAKLPKWEMRSIHVGRKEGQVQVFSRDGKAIAAQWNDAARTWIEVGEVTGSNPNAGSIDGVQYDHVLPIEVDTPDGGVQKLQIGYNNGDNPFSTAQKFIDDYMLDQNYLSQIADYIRQRVGDSNITLGSGGAAASSRPAPTTTFEMAQPPKQKRIYQHLPMKGYLAFDVPDMSKSLPKIMNKIKELNTGNSVTIDLSPLDTLQSTLLATSRYHSSTISISELNALKLCLESWDIDSIFPVLDLVRIVVLHPDAGSRSKEKMWSECKFFNFKVPSQVEMFNLN